MTAAADIQRQELVEAFGESSGGENEAHPPPALVESLDSDSHSHPSPLPLLPATADFDSSGEQLDSEDEIEAHPSANPGDVESQRRALAEVFGESSDSDGKALSSDSENEVLGESSDMENQSLEESSDSENESLGESSNSEDEIEAGTEAQILAILKAFGESSDSGNEASSEMENQSLEESSDSENEVLGESSDSDDEIEAGAEAQRRAILKAFGESSDSEDEIEAHPSILKAFGESSDSEDEIEAHPSSYCDAEGKRQALLEAFGESSDSENEALLAIGESSDSEDEAGNSSSSPVCGLALARKRAFEEVSKDSEDGADYSSRGAKVRRLALVQAFGETSDSEEEVRSSNQMMELGVEATSHRWEMVKGINGLWLCRDFLPAKHQSLLMQAIQGEGWFEGSNNNQGMRFGDLPEWATELSRSIWEAVSFAEVIGEETAEDSCMEESCPLPVDILLREPLFDQLIINVYKPGEGICAHVDLMRFDDGIAIVSLESTCLMHFTRCEQEADASEAHGGDVSPSTRIAVYLTPGSLVVLSGEARYLWKHEINRKPGFQLWEGREIKQEKRTSVTLRKLLQEPDES